MHLLNRIKYGGLDEEDEKTKQAKEERKEETAN